MTIYKVVIRLALEYDTSIWWWCLPTPMTLASVGSPMVPLVVYQQASLSIWPDCDMVSLANPLDRWNRPWHISYVLVEQGR